MSGLFLATFYKWKHFGPWDPQLIGSLEKELHPSE